MESNQVFFRGSLVLFVLFANHLQQHQRYKNLHGGSLEVVATIF